VNIYFQRRCLKCGRDHISRHIRNGITGGISEITVLNHKCEHMKISSGRRVRIRRGVMMIWQEMQEQ